MLVRRCGVTCSLAPDATGGYIDDTSLQADYIWIQIQDHNNTNKMSFIRFTNGHLCDNGVLYHDVDLYVDKDNGTIYGQVPPPTGSKIEVVDLGGNVLAPGFLDIQNNGIYGLNFSDLREGATKKDVKEFQNFYRDAMAKYLTTGVTSTCPTVTSNFPEVYNNVLPLYRRSRSQHQVDSLGAHCEGPFINLKKKGCHPTETFVDAKEGPSKLFDIYGGVENFTENVAIVTAAPEIEGVLQAIPEVVESNIVFSLGHTNADYKTAVKAVDNGATMITHLYNAMPQPHHRDVGVVGLVTSPVVGKTPYFGIICDGVHVDPSMAVIAFRSNPEKCILVTDAMHLIGLPDDTYKWDNQTIVKKGPYLYLKGTKTLAGSATTLPQCVRNLMAWANIPLAQAVKTVTNNPATSIGVQHEKGFLNKGCDADLVVLDHQGFLKAVYKLGHLIRPVDENQPSKLMAAL
ncbi:hypothetical protein PGUG_00478 [Meyerozyma guilliermondii ATCC 6260]|uniref:N-acetylglucosamine-6-phosphate deacetylase n=1 Tax=Meyerozyma guilliermondii (strain ATCC 6260 / CBS 566 / DSM 6381 / JCM 1539 / NBRC 10279 / NRRL Y-324) TaxID=294746 RepID=A5DB23_PICGU|nr:uncharacterized protein PGUG_00478 [Meyerozyma guilliermondii ATCC 6260]EDK36380.2 hypothetical protein PGUG_00478 [Meyerozyma guilliermondii ATCC 6260]